MKKGKVIFHSAKLKNLLFAAALSGILIIGGIMAYFTSSDAVTNKFVVGDVKISLNEVFPNNSIIPGKSVEKKPTVENTGRNEAFVFFRVSVPVEKVILLENDGVSIKTEETELFSLQYNNAEGVNSDHWKLIKDWYEYVDPEAETPVKKSHEYVYVYGTGTEPDEITPVEIAPAYETEELFDAVKLVNLYAWSELEKQSVQEYSQFKTREEKAAFINKLRSDGKYSSITIVFDDETDPDDTLDLDRAIEKWDALAERMLQSGTNLEGSELTVDVHAYAIQSKDLDVSSPVDIWEKFEE